MSDNGPDQDFTLGRPVLVCRWRLASGKLPMENRHLRALSKRVVNGRAVSTQLVAWAKQHIEWTLQDGSARCMKNGWKTFVAANCASKKTAKK